MAHANQTNEPCVDLDLAAGFAKQTNMRPSCWVPLLPCRRPSLRMKAVSRQKKGEKEKGDPKTTNEYVDALSKASALGLSATGPTHSNLCISWSGLDSVTCHQRPPAGTSNETEPPVATRQQRDFSSGCPGFIQGPGTCPSDRTSLPPTLVLCGLDYSNLFFHGLPVSTLPYSLLLLACF